MFALRQSGRDHWIVQVVRGRDMHDLYFRIGDQRLITAVAFPRSKLLRFAPSRIFTASSNGNNIDESKTPHRIDVMRPDEARSDDPHTHSLLLCLFVH